MAKATSSRTASADKRDIFLKSVLRASASAFVVAGVTFAPLAHAQDSGPQSDDPEVGADPASVSDDVIVVTGSLPQLPETFQRNLSVGGRLIAFTGDDPAMEMILITRVSENEWSHQVLLETSVPALINAVEPERFVL